MLRHVTVPAGKGIGLHLMTVSHRPIIQAIWNKELTAQGVKPCDVLVSINGKPLGDIDAVRKRLLCFPYFELSKTFVARQVEAARLLSEARQALEGEDDRALRGVRAGMGRTARTISLGLLKMAPLDSQSSYNSQHPVDVAAALTSYDPVSMTGVLCFSVPRELASDK